MWEKIYRDRYVYYLKNIAEFVSMATSSQFEDCFNQSIRKQLCLNDDNEKDQQPNMPAHSKLLDVEIDLKAMLNNVVKIFCTEIPCSFHMPW